MGYHCLWSVLGVILKEGGMGVNRGSLSNRGMVLGFALLLLSLVCVLVLSIKTVHVGALADLASNHPSSIGQYAARAAAYEALDRIQKSSRYGTTDTDSFSVNLPGNVMASANFLSGFAWSRNNLSGSTSLKDGLGYEVPPGCVRINGYAHVGRKTVIYSILASSSHPGVQKLQITHSWLQ